jgi:hypothetical protein
MKVSHQKWIFVTLLGIGLFGSGVWLKNGSSFEKREQAYDGKREPTSSAELPPPELDEVWGPEQEVIAQEIANRSIETAKKNASKGFVHRDAHPKHHGCVKATWSAEASQLPAHLQLGPLAPGSEYEAWVRFSNGSPSGVQAPDSDADVRGMAVKLLNVPGADSGNQDLVLMTSPRFFSHDAHDYLQLVRSLDGGTLALLSYLATHPTNAWIINKARVTGTNPLDFTYSSAVPFKLGPSTMRYRLQSCVGQPQPVKGDQKNPNFMSSSLAATLNDRTYCYDVMVQPNQDLEKNPTEDPRRFWDETRSPFVLAARLNILQQQGIETNQMMAFCENLSFNPWRTHPDIRPMGQMNRIRKVTYDAVSKFRHDSNARHEIEPVDLNPCQNPKTLALCQ